mgnify:CR=1 FL=1
MGLTGAGSVVSNLVYMSINSLCEFREESRDGNSITRVLELGTISDKDIFQSSISLDSFGVTRVEAGDIGVFSSQISNSS